MVSLAARFMQGAGRAFYDGMGGVSIGNIMSLMELRGVPLELREPLADTVLALLAETEAAVKEARQEAHRGEGGIDGVG